MSIEQSMGKRFGTVRRDGYDPAEVDRHIESAEQAARGQEAKIAGLEDANTTMRAALVTANERVRELEDELARKMAESATALVAPTPVEPVAPVAPVAGDTVRTTSHTASRMLEKATEESEALVAEARRESDQLLATARAEAAETVQKALDKVHAREEALDAMEAETREELETLRVDTLREVEARRSDLEARVTNLTDFEDQVRGHLVSYFNEQLAVLEQPIAAPAVVLEHPHAS